jgi:hypothetical protein
VIAADGGVTKGPKFHPAIPAMEGVDVVALTRTATIDIDLHKESRVAKPKAALDLHCVRFHLPGILLVTDPAAPAPRPTKDVLIEVGSPVEYYAWVRNAVWSMRT